VVTLTVANVEVEQRGASPTTNEADLSGSSTPSTRYRRRGPRSLQPIVRRLASHDRCDNCSPLTCNAPLMSSGIRTSKIAHECVSKRAAAIARVCAARETAQIRTRTPAEYRSMLRSSHICRKSSVTNKQRAPGCWWTRQERPGSQAGRTIHLTLHSPTGPCAPQPS
jgi:hypothetical protein